MSKKHVFLPKYDILGDKRKNATFAFFENLQKISGLAAIWLFCTGLGYENWQWKLIWWTYAQKVHFLNKMAY